VECGRNARRGWQNVDALRGAVSTKHFEADGQHYLAIAQSLCNAEEVSTAQTCYTSGIVNPQSAILEWDGMCSMHARLIRFL
jgi:hypothetical protein